jgi:PPM family protein phosphatase
VSRLTLVTAVRTDAGLVRSHNEDAVFASPELVAVADGVGGAAAGEVASRAVIDALIHLDKCRLTGPLPDALRAAVKAGNDAIGFITSCRPRTRGMATTLTAVALGDGYTVANVGDSRTYLFREGRLAQLTRDDSFVQSLVDSGELDPADAPHHPRRSVVLAVLDGDPAREASVTTHAARPGDRLLLCSDGLTDLVGDTALAAALAIPSRERCAARLVELALAAGGRDNVSVIVADAIPAAQRAA